MKLYTIILVAVTILVAHGAKTQKHKFISLDNMDPSQLVSLMKGDWKAMLPEPLKSLLKNDDKEQTEGDSSNPEEKTEAETEGNTE